MGQLGVVEFVTLDGVMQGFASPDDDRDRGFERGGWGAPYRHPVESESAVAGFVERSAYLFGRRTYEGMIRFWPDQPSGSPRTRRGASFGCRATAACTRSSRCSGTGAADRWGLRAKRRGAGR